MLDVELLELIDRACRKLSDAGSLIHRLVEYSNPFLELSSRFEKYSINRLHDEFLNTMRETSVSVERSLRNLDAYKWCFRSRAELMTKEFYELLAAINEIETLRKEEDSKREERLKELADTDAREYTAEVVTLDGEERDRDGRPYGRVFALVWSGEQGDYSETTSACLTLTVDDYAVACSAHLTGRRVAFKGVMGYDFLFGDARIRCVENFRIEGERSSEEAAAEGNASDAEEVAQ